MKPSEYILSQLEKLRKTENFVVPQTQLIDYIVGRILSKKFRKYAVDEAFKDHVKKVVTDSVENNEPITMVWVFGGYKLWRIPTTPKADWGELFSMIYFARYVKLIAEVYDPGVVFDFYSDDVIVSRMDNISEQDIADYLQSFRQLLKFIAAYLPKNVNFEFNRVGDQYGEGDFDKELEQNIIKLKTELPDGLPKIDDIKKAMVELNVKLESEQAMDPKWREKVLLIHDAYAMSHKRRPYYRNEKKIMVVNNPLPCTVAIGTTKASVAKFWCGMGVLEKRSGEYIEKILSPKQLKNSKIVFEPICIDGLDDNNFQKIGIVE